MVASVGRITAGTGYEYLTREVATSRHDYYTGQGEAPGVWAGGGCSQLGLAGVVDPDDMAALFGRFVDPRTVGQVLPDGAAVPELVLGRRVSTRVRKDGSVLEPVAAFDVTFSPSKSASVLWATASDPQVRQAVLDAHEAGVSAGLGYLEDNAGHARAGVDGIRRVEGTGLIIAQFRHRTARATGAPGSVGDPQLHSHCAILNRVCGVDGVWRTLDSKAIYRHAHAAGALYAATFERSLSERLGVSWTATADRVPMREIEGVPPQLVRLWSSRRQQVLLTYETMLDRWHAATGRTPTRKEKAGLLDKATLRSRPPKTRGDVDLHQAWRAQLTAEEQAAIESAGGRPVVTDGGRLPAGSVALTEAVFASLHEQRAWWTRAHVFAEVARLVQAPEREVIEVEVERLLTGCISLEPDDDNTYAQWDATKFTSPTILNAERRVVAAAGQPARWSVPVNDTTGLGDDQADAVAAIAFGPSFLTTVIGPAGAGKTTMLRATAAAFEAAGRPVAVFTLSAAAARVVTEETGVPATTIASWKVGKSPLPHDGLIVIDEASMVPTLTLDQLLRSAAAQRCRVTFVGDYAQMGAPEAGGLLRDLTATPTAVHLTSVRRFRHDWEGEASKLLRQRDPDATAVYAAHARLVDVTTDTATDTTARAWLTDTLDGRDSIIVVDNNAVAGDVSARCQALLAAADQLGQRVASGADHNAICIGDLIQTRQNSAALATSDGRRVLNRDVWHVTGASADGSITAAHTRSGSAVVIPADYLSTHVVLAYATTIAGAQGRTVDTGHVIVTPRTSASALYVGMTRGRHTNQAYVVTDSHDHDEFELGERTLATAFSAALSRDPEGQKSATAIGIEWQRNRRHRASARQGDTPGPNPAGCLHASI
ncbi:unannotated protein [freshwater metagenome]|jgi:conjugative relaxase-like TrwC/TraI family protein|uniref:Unannotated protein n=1 Tax=freshwater metagenome TaxID=449393 RepID=A0A6J6D9R6_9ZZZZ